MKTPLNRKTIQQHFQYSWWMYVLAAVLCVFVWDMAYIMSAPRTPEELKLELYIYGYGDSANVDAYLDRVHAEELPDMVEVTAMYLLPDETSGLMVLATRLMAGEGDLFLLPRDSFQSYAAQGVFTALDQMEGIQELCEDAGINIERGWRKNQDTGERHLYGLPVSSMTGLSTGINTWTYATSEMYLCVRELNGNDENAEKLLRIILRDCLPGEEQAQPQPEPETVPTEAPASQI